MASTDATRPDAPADWLRDELVEAFGEETEGWARDRAVRVATRLQALDEPGAPRLEPVVLWLPEPMAFVAPGRYVFITRELLQRLHEDSAAMAFAHELGHVRLGHLDRLERMVRWTSVKKIPGFSIAALAFQVATKLVSSPANERAADRFALERCVAAGFDGRRCLDLFRVLERFALDRRDLDAVFGPDDTERLAELELRRLDGDASRLDAFELWARQLGHSGWERRTGYPALRERRHALEVQLGAHRGKSA